jgi:hypothetical protein
MRRVLLGFAFFVSLLCFGLGLWAADLLRAASYGYEELVEPRIEELRLLRELSLHSYEQQRAVLNILALPEQERIEWRHRYQRAERASAEIQNRLLARLSTRLEPADALIRSGSDYAEAAHRFLNLAGDGTALRLELFKENDLRHLFDTYLREQEALAIYLKDDLVGLSAEASMASTYSGRRLARLSVIPAILFVLSWLLITGMSISLNLAARRIPQN